MAKTLLDLLYEADAIQIDDLFVRYFYMEHEEIENDDDIILHIETEADFVNYEFFFTKRQLETAVKYEDIDGWKVDGDTNGGRGNLFQIVPYKVSEIKG